MNELKVIFSAFQFQQVQLKTCPSLSYIVPKQDFNSNRYN